MPIAHASTYVSPLCKAIIAPKAMPKFRAAAVSCSRLGYGFHDDEFTSGLRAVADHIDGVQLPFVIADVDRKPRVIFVAPLFGLLEVTGIGALKPKLC
jgi:hypothetical protein